MGRDQFVGILQYLGIDGAWGIQGLAFDVSRVKR